MKNPLIYQTTEYDCCFASYINALSYLFTREELPAELIKGIQSYTLDLYQKKDPGSGGTSRIAHLLLSHFLANYSKIHEFPLSTEMYYSSKVKKDLFQKILTKGVIVTRVYLKTEHYVLVVKIDEKYIYLFDPYYLEENPDPKEVEFIDHHPKLYNRKVTLTRFFSTSKEILSLGPINKRECNALYRIKKKSSKSE